MSTVPAVAAIARVQMRLWRRELAQTLRIPAAAVVGVALGILVLTLLVGVALSAVVLQLTADLPSDTSGVDPTTPLALVTAGGLAAVAVYCLLFLISMPDRTALDSVIDALPVPRSHATLGVLVPVVAIVLLFVHTMSLPTYVFTASVGGERVVAAVAVLAVAFTVAVPTIVAGYQVLRGALRRRQWLPAAYQTPIAAGIVFGLAVASSLSVMMLTSPGGVRWGVLSPAVDVALLLIAVVTGTAPSVGALIGLLGWTVVSVLLIVSAARIRHRADSSTSVRLFVGFGVPRGPRRTAVWYAAIPVVRTPRYLLIATAVLAGSVLVTVLLRQDIGSGLLASVPTLLVVLPFLQSVFVVGANSRTTWVSALGPLGLRSGLVDVLAALAVGTLIAVPAGAVLVAGGALRAHEIPTALALALMLCACGVLCGALLPVTDDHALSAVVTTLTTAVSYLMLLLAMGWAAGQGLDVAPELLQIGAATLLFVLFAVTGRRRPVALP